MCGVSPVDLAAAWFLSTGFGGFGNDNVLLLQRFSRLRLQVDWLNNCGRDLLFFWWWTPDLPIGPNGDLEGAREGVTERQRERDSWKCILMKEVKERVVTRSDL